MKLNLQRRSHFGWPSSASAPSASCHKGTVVHYNDKAKMNFASKPHSACENYWKNTRKFHMGPSRRWNDIGYSFAVCPHGITMEGRGARRAQAAQPGGNTTWHSVTFMSGEGEVPTEKQKEQYRALRAWLRAVHGMAAGESKHKSFLSTSCPGSTLSKMVDNGSLRTGKSTPTKPKPPAKPGTTAPAFPLPKGHWFGPAAPDARNHSGFWEKDRTHIRKFQAKLKERGWGITATGRFDATTKQVVMKFQAEKGLRVDNLVGSVTWGKIWTAPTT